MPQPALPNIHAGFAELRSTLGANAPTLWFCAIFSVFVNILMLTGPIFMLQVYDRVLTSRSEATLFALMAIVAFLYLIMGVLDHTRGRLLARVGARFQGALDQRVFAASLRADQIPSAQTVAQSGIRDLEAIRQFLSSPVLATCFDLPFTPVFLAGIWIFHPWLGMLAIAGGGLLICVTLLSTWLTRRPVIGAAVSGHRAQSFSENLQRDPGMLRGLGMEDAAFHRWRQLRSYALTRAVQSGDAVGRFTVLTKTLRLFLQSAMLGLGAWLVLAGELSPGAMIAGSILMGRALAPIEQAIGGWSVVQQARRGRDNLAKLLALVPVAGAHTDLPRPKALLNVHQLTVLPPGETQAALRMVSFTAEPGQAIGVIGASGAGKSTLAQALSGAWPVAGGHIRLDGATLDQYGAAALGTHIGYLPQRVTLYEGTVAENIAGLAQNPEDSAVIAAAKKADAHEMILRLPDGYNTVIQPGNARISGGQTQRIGLARAMYGAPVVLILDEPNSNLDNSGSDALNQAIRQMKSAAGLVLIMAHRPAAIQECNQILMLDAGQVKAFGPKDDVLRSVLQNHRDVSQNPGPGGIS